MVLLASSQAGQLAGRDAKALVGSSILEAVPPPLRQIALRVLRRVVEKNKDCKLLQPLAGKMLSVELRPVCRGSSVVSNVAVYVQDVTDQIAREQAGRHKDALLETIAHAATRLLYESGWQDGLDDVLERIGLALQADRVLVLARQVSGADAGTHAVVGCWSSRFAESLGGEEPGTRPCIGEMVGRWATKLSKGQWVAGNARSFPSRERKILEASRVRSLVVVPVFCRERWWGLLCACSEESERDWTRGELEAVRVAADTLGAAILRTAVEEELSRTNRELVQSIDDLRIRSRNAEILSEMSDLLQGAVQVDEAAQIAAESAESLMPNSSGAVSLQPEQGANYHVVSTWGPTNCSAPSFSKDDCWALRRGHAYGWSKQRKLNCRHLQAPCDDAGDPRWLCVPIVGPSGTLGVISLLLGDSPTSETAEYLAHEVADRLGLALANLALRSELEILSSQDPLTGLFNRRHMEQTLASEIKRSIRHGHPISILMMDLDHFKSLNDHYGHDAGDTFLREFAAYLRLRFRTEDVACRYGGEEFVVIMPETTVANAELKSRQLREHVRRMIVEHKSKVLGKTTVSVGIAGYPDHGTTPEQLLRAADQALYEAKRKGRDRSVVAPAQRS